LGGWLVDFAKSDGVFPGVLYGRLFLHVFKRNFPEFLVTTEVAIGSRYNLPSYA
jgi:hypothetical protein